MSCLFVMAIVQLRRLSMKSLSLLILALIPSCSDVSAQSTWVRVFGGASEDRVVCVSSLPDGTYMLAGTTRSYDSDFSHTSCARDQGAWMDTYGFLMHIDDQGRMIRASCMPEAPGKIVNHMSIANGNQVVVSGTIVRHSFDGSNGGLFDAATEIYSVHDMAIQKLYSFPGTAEEYSRSHAITNDSCIVVTGYTSSNDDFFRGMNKMKEHSSHDVFLVKVGPKGEIRWKKTFGGSASDQGLAIDWAPRMGIVLAGNFESSDGDFRSAKREGWSDAFLSRHNQLGELIWIRTMGGSQHDHIASVAISGDSEIVVVGTISSRNRHFTSEADTNSAGWFMAKYDASGIERWRLNLNGIGVGDHGLKIDSVGNIFVAGSIEDAHGNDLLQDDRRSDILIRKYSSDGEVLWSTTLGGRGTEHATAICFAKDGGIVVAGQTVGDKGDQFNDGIFSGLGKGVPNDNLQNGHDVFVIKLDRNGKLMPKN
jgi:hypothetical protein